MFLSILSVSAVAQSESPQSPSQIDREHTAWIAGALNAMQTIKVGMTHSDVMKVFTTEGGLSTISQRILEDCLPICYKGGFNHRRMVL